MAYQQRTLKSETYTIIIGSDLSVVMFFNSNRMPASLSHLPVGDYDFFFHQRMQGKAGEDFEANMRNYIIGSIGKHGVDRLNKVTGQKFKEVKNG